MSDLYTYIQDGKIIEGPRPLPKSWGNISGLNLLADKSEGVARLKALGWYPWDNTKTAHDAKAEKATWDNKSFEVVDNIAKPVWVIEARDLGQELADKKAALLDEKAELEARMAREAALLKYDGGDIPTELLDLPVL